MNNNDDLEIDLSDENREQLLSTYVSSNMTSGSMEVFERELKKGDVLSAAGYALLNEVITICLTEMVDKNKTKDKE